MARWPMGLRVVSVVCTVALMGIPVYVAAQEMPPQGAPQQYEQYGYDSAPPNQQPLLSAQQLDDMVAPIALYPDQLVSQVLVATTYPLEVVEASQWIQQNRFSGRQAVDAARQMSWDPSVQALVAFPDALNLLAGDVQWTTALGNAFLAQQGDVMAAVQRMRVRAEQNGRLRSTPQQRVETVYESGQPEVEILPVDPNVVYVPTYDPYYVWGAPAWGYYPNLYYGYAGFGFGPGINIGLCFDSWGGWYGYGGWGWGWRPNWYGRSVFVNNVFFERYGYRGNYSRGLFGGVSRSGTWQHDPSHRWGVPYPTRQLSSRFQSASIASRANMGRVGGQGFNGYRNGVPQNMNRGYQQGSGAQRFQGQAGNGGAYQRFQNNAPQTRNYAQPQQRFQAPQQRNQAPQQRFQAPQQRFQAPQQQFQAPQQRFQAPQQRNQAPQQRFQAPQQQFQAPQQRFQAPQQRFQQMPQQRFEAPQQRFQAPQQRFQAPQQRFEAPRFQAPQQQHVQAAPQQRAQASQGGGGGSHGGGGGDQRGGHRR